MRQLKLSGRGYTAQEHPDPQDARRVVLALGVGQHIVVNPKGARAVHGNIHSIDSEQFTLIPDHAAGPVTIAYNEIRHVEKNLSLGGTILLTHCYLSWECRTLRIISAGPQTTEGS